MKPFAKLMMAVGILSLCSCSDDELSELNFRSDDSQNVESTTAFTPSYCYIWDINHLDGQKIAINGNASVKATDSKNIFHFEQSRMDDGSMALVARLNPGVKFDAAVADEVVITSLSNPEEKQTITLVLRDDAAADAIGATRGDISPEDRFAEYFSRAYQLWGDIGYTPAHPVLKANVLKADELVDCTVAPSYTYKQTTNSSLSDVTTEHASKFGLSFTGVKPMRNPLMQKLPEDFVRWFDDFNIGGSLTKSTTKKQRELDEYEYVRGTKEYIAASASLNSDKMERLHPNYITLIDETFNAALNDTKSDLYKKYGNDTTGIYDLLDYYGSFLATGGTFGASFEYLYSRKRAVTEYSIEEQLCMELTADRVKERKIELDKLDDMASNSGRLGQLISGLNEAGIKPTTKWDKKVDPFTGKISYDKKNGLNDYRESTESNLEVLLRGGNCNTIGEKYGEFNAGNDPSKWWIVDYNFKINGNEQPANFIPVYELCTEPVRKAAIIKALTPVEDPATGLRLSPYVKARHCPITVKPTKSRIVLADFRACYLDSKRPEGYPKCKIMEGPDGKKRTYYCLAANRISNEIPNGQPFSIDIKAYTGGNPDKAMLFYYAFDYADQCQGFTDIDCKKAPITGNWKQRGNRTDKGLGWWYFSTEKYVCIQPATDETPDSDKITGVAVWSEDRGWPVSSTAGTTPDDEGFYGTYWKAHDYESKIHKSKALVMVGKFQDCYLWLESTKEDLKLRCTFEYDKNGNELRPQIKMPDTWQ